MTEDGNITKKDLYRILGCSQDASLEQLKQGYHSKILESHPDKNKNSPNTNSNFQQIHSAWKVLSDPVLKKEYDVRWQQENLQAQGALVYARIIPAELDVTDDENILSYQCRCGNYYLVDKTDLSETNCIIHVPCQDCTFVIAVET